MNETTLDVVGGLTADPELRYTQNGMPVANFTIASTQRIFDRQANDWKDGDQLFLRCTAWRELAEHVAQSLTKGSRVLANVTLKTEKYNDRDGNERVAIVGTVNDIGASLRYGTTSFTRAAKPGAQRQQQPQQDAWATPSDDETPF